MQIRHFQLQFLTPAFLGDANQSGRWRTPPFKAQLRQWWRVAYAAQKQFSVNVREMRDIEGRLFGHAWLEDDRDEDNNKVAARKGLVRLRLNRWDEGHMKSWQAADRIQHPEVGMVDSLLYMGYGPVLLPRGSRETTLKANAAIQANEAAELRIAYPGFEAPLIEKALGLMHLLGTVGGRSHNAWGSYSLMDTQTASPPQLVVPNRNWPDCLRLDWPHALGTDAKGSLIWQTEPHKDWISLMKTLAQIKIALRTQPCFKFPNAQPDGAIHDRHWLSYPITRHDVNDWKRKNLRLPNQLRFKVRPTLNGQLVGAIFHMPHKPPADFGSDPKTLERIWVQVHSHLDQTATLKRTAA